MDWLMGKARNVRGFMTTSGTATAASNSPTGSGSGTGSSANSAGGGGGSLTNSNSNMAMSSNSLTPAYLDPVNLSKQLPLPAHLDYNDLVELQPPAANVWLDQNEWLASHLISLFENVSCLVDVMAELCHCPVATGPNNVQFVVANTPDERHHHGGHHHGHGHHHHHGHHHGSTSSSSSSKKARRLNARQYMEFLLSNCFDLIKSRETFPSRQGQPFSADLRPHSQIVCRHLLHCLAHIYAAHFALIGQLELTAHLNTVAKHFFTFVAQFSLLDEKETEVVADLQAALLRTPPPPQQPPNNSAMAAAAAAAANMFESEQQQQANSERGSSAGAAAGGAAEVAINQSAAASLGQRGGIGSSVPIASSYALSNSQSDPNVAPPHLTTSGSHSSLLNASTTDAAKAKTAGGNAPL